MSSQFILFWALQLAAQCSAGALCLYKQKTAPRYGHAQYNLCPLCVELDTVVRVPGNCTQKHMKANTILCHIAKGRYMHA